MLNGLWPWYFKYNKFTLICSMDLLPFFFCFLNYKSIDGILIIFLIFCRWRRSIIYLLKFQFERGNCYKKKIAVAFSLAKHSSLTLRFVNFPRDVTRSILSRYLCTLSTVHSIYVSLHAFVHLNIFTFNQMIIEQNRIHF